MITSLPGVNINIENAILMTPINTKAFLLFPSSPLTTKNIPTNNIKKYQNPITSPLNRITFRKILHQLAKR